jgi:hypothetical protein
MLKLPEKLLKNNKKPLWRPRVLVFCLKKHILLTWQVNSSNNHRHLLAPAGLYIGIKRLGQRTEFFRESPFEHFDLREGSIVVLGKQFSRGLRYGIALLFSTAPAVALLRIPDTDWEGPDGWCPPLPAPRIYQ